MKKVNIEVVIGSNYGDEGKGLASAMIAYGSKTDKCLTVLYNGGAQRGHTVESKDTEGFRHVCHSIGAGTAINKSDTFYNKHFMINPYIFLEEKAILNYHNRVWVDPRCQITTPYDIMINRELEYFRSKNRHGSCGLGIFETFNRVNHKYIFTYSDIRDFDSTKNLVLTLRDNYFIDRINELKEEKSMSFSNEFYSSFYSEDLLDNFIDTLISFKHNTYIAYLSQIVEYYDTIIYEGAQGLMLDMDNMEDWPHLTPSKTGSSWVIEELKEIKDIVEMDINTYYITRTYLTRHGAGSLEREADPKKMLKEYIIDKTNMPNPWQETLRYARMDSKRTLSFIQKDQSLWNELKCNFHLVVTHWNELPDISGILLSEKSFKDICVLSSPYYDI